MLDKEREVLEDLEARSSFVQELSAVAQVSLLPFLPSLSPSPLVREGGGREGEVTSPRSGGGGRGHLTAEQCVMSLMCLCTSRRTKMSLKYEKSMIPLRRNGEKMVMIL